MMSKCWCDSNRRDSEFQNFCVQLFQHQNYSPAQFFFNAVAFRVLISFIAATWHGALLFYKSNIPIIKSKREKLPWPVTLGLILSVFLGGMTPLLFRSNPTLCISVQLFWLTREMFRSPCTRLSMVGLILLEWMSLFFEHAPPTSNSLDHTVITNNKKNFIVVWFLWEHLSVINCLEVYLPSRVYSSSVGGRLLR